MRLSYEKGVAGMSEGKLRKGTLKISGERTQKPNPYDVLGPKGLYLKLAKPQVRNVEIFNEAGKRVGHSEISARRFTDEFTQVVKEGIEIPVEYTTSKDGMIKTPRHRVNVADNPAVGVAITGDRLDISAYNFHLV